MPDLGTAGTGSLEEAKLLPSDGAAGDHFGTAVAIDENLAVIGTSHHDLNGDYSGAAYVFRRSGVQWSQEAKLFPKNANANDWFGHSVDVSRDTAIVGAPKKYETIEGGGAAFVFQRDGSSWSQQAELLPDDQSAGRQFGASVAISGDIAVAGAVLSDDNGAASGAAYVFVRNGRSWSQRAKILPNDGVSAQFFGSSVAIFGKTIAIGAQGDTTNGFSSGAAYVFVLDAQGNWSQQGKLVPSDGTPEQSFGYSIAVSEDTVIVGPVHDDDSGYDSGSAYVFVRDGYTWFQQAKLLASDGRPLAHFGWTVSIDKDIAIVGANGTDHMGDFSGGAYLFRRASDQWTQRLRFHPGDVDERDLFGSRVSLSGGTAVVSSPSDDDNGTSSGSAYVFRVGSVIFGDDFESDDLYSWSSHFACVGCPIADFSYTTNGLTVQFLNQSTGDPADFYTWWFRDGTTSTDEHPLHTYASPGTYYVKLRMINSLGQDSITKAVTVEQ